MEEIKYRREDEMKDSGIEWLGKIPKEWEVTKLKYLADHKPNSFTDGDWIESKYIVDQGVRLIQTGNIGIGKYIEKGDRYISEETYKKLNCTEVKENDILICRLAHPVGRACLAPSLGNKMITSVDVCILKPNNQFDRRYIVYSLTNNRYLYYADMIARGGTRQRISRTQLGDIDIYKLPLFEQQKIANFLDIKTSQFDSIISKKEKLIEKLEEAKKSLISEVVTGKVKIVDGKMVERKAEEMKDSGVEWLGMIPKDWEVSTFRRYTRLQQGLQIAENLRFKSPGENRFKYITVKYINSNSIDNLYYIENPPKSVICSNNDILFTRTGATGQVVTNVNGVFHNNFFKVNYNRKFIIKEYLVYYLKNPLLQEYFLLISGTTTIPDLNHGDFLNTKLLIPNLKVQKIIIDFLNKKIKDINNIISKTKTQIHKLKEAKESLISEAVTGKIDLRDWEIREVDEI